MQKISGKVSGVVEALRHEWVKKTETGQWSIGVSGPLLIGALGIATVLM